MKTDLTDELINYRAPEMIIGKVTETQTESKASEYFWEDDSSASISQSIQSASLRGRENPVDTTTRE